MTVGTRNAQSSWATEKLELLEHEMKRFRYDIIGILVVRWIDGGETSNEDFIWSGEDNTHAGGVGLLLCTKARKALIGCNPISLRIITTRFNAPPFKIPVAHAYAPTSTRSDEDIGVFYSTLENAPATTLRKVILIMTGDWNAKVECDNADWKRVMGRHGYGIRNE